MSTATKSSSSAASFATLKTSSNDGAITWGDALDSVLSSVIESVVEAGYLISFGRTSDGGALVLSIIEDGKPVKFYFANREDLSVKLGEIEAYAKDL